MRTLQSTPTPAADTGTDVQMLVEADALDSAGPDVAALREAVRAGGSVAERIAAARALVAAKADLPAAADGKRFTVEGVEFEAFRFPAPRPHWRIKIVETGEVWEPGVAGLNYESVPKLIASLQDLARRAGGIAEWRRRLDLPAREAANNEPDSRQAFEHMGRRIYPTEVFGLGQRWAVQSRENQGSDRKFGDALFKTEAEARAEVERDAESRTRAAEQARQRAEQEAADKAARYALRGDLDQFLAGMSPPMRARADAALTNSIRYGSEPMMKFQAIRKMVEAGGQIRGVNGKPALRTPEGSFYLQSDITKTGMDFAEFLIWKRHVAAQKAGAALDSASPDREALRATVKTGATLAERLAAARALVQPAAGPVAPLYVNRPVVNAADILAWAASQGFGTTLAADDLHVTVAYSKQPMQWSKAPPQQDTITVSGGARSVQPLGSEGAVVLKFDSPELQQRWQQYRDAGASWDYDGYTPHVTITYQGQGVDLAQVQPYDGPIVLGAERQETLDDSKTVAEVKTPEATPAVAVHVEPVRAGDVYAAPTGDAVTVMRTIPGGKADVRIQSNTEGRRMRLGTFMAAELKAWPKIGRADYADGAYTTPQALIDAAKARSPRTAGQIAEAIAKASPAGDVLKLREEARKAIVAELGEDAAAAISHGNWLAGDDLTQAIHDGQYQALREFAASLPVPVLEDDIPMEVAVRAYSGTSHSPERRGASARRGYVQALVSAWRQGAGVAGEDTEKLTRVTEAFRDVAAGYRARTIAALGANSRVVSTNVAGPANFPVRAMQKRGDTADKRSAEAAEFLQAGVKRMLKAAADPVDNSPQGEMQNIRSRIEQREKDQARMKAANAAIRKGDDAALIAMGFNEASIVKLKQPDFAGRTGFADWMLTNNNAEIRRLRERLAEVERRVAAAAEAPKEREQGGVRIVEDAEDDRLRLFFPDKPTAEVRDALKSAAFKWSPNAGAWQRQLTDNARRAAQDILNRFFPAGDAPKLDSAADAAEPPDRGQALATLRAIASGKHPDMLDPELLDRLEDLRAAFPADAELLALADEAAARLAKGPG